MNRQLRNKNWIETTINMDKHNVMEITLTTVADKNVKTHIVAQIYYKNKKVADAIMAGRRMNIYKTIATLAEFGKVWENMDTTFYTGKGITLPLKIKINVYDMFRDNGTKLVKVVELDSTVTEEDTLDIYCRCCERTEMKESKITFKTKLPKYVNEQEMTQNENKAQTIEPAEPEKQEPQNKCKSAKVKNQLTLYKTVTVKTHEGKRITLMCNNIFKNNNQTATAILKVVGREHLTIDVTITTSEEDPIDVLQTKWKQICNIIRKPHLMKSTKFESLRIREYNSKKEIFDFEITLDREKIYWYDSRLQSQNLNSCDLMDALDKNSDYIFYNPSRVMHCAWDMVKTYKKSGKELNIGIAIKYFAAAEKVYQGVYQDITAATREISREILLLTKDKSTKIFYSIPYYVYKNHFEDALKFYERYITVLSKNYSKETKSMDLELVIERKQYVYDNYINEKMYDRLMKAEKILYRTHFDEIKKEMGVYFNGYGTYWEIGKREISKDKEEKLKKLLRHTYIINDYDEIINMMQE